MRTVSDSLKDLLARIFARSENFVSGRYWSLEVVFLAVLFSVLFSGGIDDRLWVINDNYSGGYFEKIRHPLYDIGRASPPLSHDNKLNFRLTVPVVLHVLGVPPEEHWVLPVLTACATCAILWISCLFAFRVTGDRVCGLYVTLAVASTYIGSLAFTRYYDAIAISQLLLAMLPGIPRLFKGALVFTAGFTDERALVAASALLAYSLGPGSAGVPVRKRLLNPDVLAILGGIAAYGVGRFLLIEWAGLSSPNTGNGVATLMNNFPFWHAGVWLALKGGWLLIGLALFSLWERRQILQLAAFAGAIALILVAGFVVEDVLRSTSYVLPAFLMALAVVGGNEKPQWMRGYCLAAFVISAVSGSYNVWLNSISWFHPLAAKFVYFVLNMITHAGPAAHTQ